MRPIPAIIEARTQHDNKSLACVRSNDHPERYALRETDLPAEDVQKFEVWAFGGGKGGTGKSALCAAVGFQLSRLGKRVVMVDADFGGANLHTCLGVLPPVRSLSDFIRDEGTIADGYAMPTPYPGLRLIGGRVDEGAGSLPVGWATRLSTSLRALPVDCVLIDLGAGVSSETIEAMNIADLKVLVTVPEPTATENVASLLRSLCLQRLVSRLSSNDVRRRLVEMQAGHDLSRVRSVDDLLRAIEAIDPLLVGAARALLEEMAVTIVTNQVRDDADRRFGAQTAAVVRRHFGLPVSYAGFVHQDDAVWRTLRRGKMFMVDASRSRAAEDIRRLTRGLLRRADLSPVF
jgi:flagellar biosynthesis protein FlhG